MLGLKGCAGCVCRAICLTRTYADCTGIALVLSVVIGAVLYITAYALNLLVALVTGARVHLFV